MTDPYARLRPPSPTSEAELCPLPLASPLKLMPALAYNPVHCMDCNLEVPPSVLALPPGVIDELADWTAVYNAIDSLWLDSGAYERWAADQLADVSSPVNVRGLALRERIAPIRTCYYWLFQDESRADFRPVEACPRCRGSFRSYPGGVISQMVCDECGIVTVGTGPSGGGHGLLPVN